jgi:hypothetical protein
MKLKYVMGAYGPVIFPETYTHSDIAKGLDQFGRIGSSIKSAGFLYIDWDEQEQRFSSKPHGESISLELKSDPENDKRVIDRILNNDY